MLISIDLKTTGENLRNDKILKISLTKFNPKTFEIDSSFSSLINPEKQININTLNLLSINNEDILIAPYIDEISDKIINFIEDSTLVWYNITNNLWFLINSWIDIHDNIIIDTFYIENFLWDIEKSYEIIDSILIIKKFSHIIKKISKLSKINKEILKYIISKTEDRWLVFILDNYLDRDILLIDSSIFTSYLLKNFKVLDKSKELFIDRDIKIKESKNILSEINKVEIRDNQGKMLDIVDNCLDKNKLNLIEAPTGLWKTFAYLLPSILYSIKNWEQVFISTTTKTLQDQIYIKDLKFLYDNLDHNFSYSKLKWRKNYFWINNFFTYFLWSQVLNLKQSSFILKIVFWLFRTKSFELDEIEYNPEEFSFSDNISADSNIIYDKNNPFEKREPFIIARKLAKKSNIVVINNSILFHDILSDNSILWNIKNLVLDEAHNLEDVVTSSLKKSFSLKELEKSFYIILAIFKKHRYENKDFIKYSENLILNISIIFDNLEEYLNYKIQNEDYKNILIEEDFYDNDIDNFDLNNLMMSIKSTFLILIDDLKILPDSLYIEITKELEFLENVLDIIDKLSDKDSAKKYIKTINYSSYRWLFLEYTFLDIWEFLDKKLWSKLNSCVLTSATLSNWDNFDYISNILKLDKFEFNKLSSDFNYKKQSLIYIPNDLWNIKNNTENIINFLKDFIFLVKWRTLILFTAIYTLKYIYSSIYLDLKKSDINLYAQSIWLWNNSLLEIFKHKPEKSVLFGTDSFWEGIDIPWEDLKYLIIHKIPFMVPSDPIFKARSVLFKDSFKDYSIPKSIIKLRQWFWRLIRTKYDSWIVIFLDDRLINSSWGYKLFEAFPNDINIKIWASDKLFNVLKK